jgi:hypothetical protein
MGRIAPPFVPGDLVTCRDNQIARLGDPSGDLYEGNRYTVERIGLDDDDATKFNVRLEGYGSTWYEAEGFEMYLRSKYFDFMNKAVSDLAGSVNKKTKKT